MEQQFGLRFNGNVEHTDAHVADNYRDAVAAINAERLGESERSKRSSTKPSALDASATHSSGSQPASATRRQAFPRQRTPSLPSPTKRGPAGPPPIQRSTWRQPGKAARARAARWPSSAT
jgi:hypothetical protein